MPQFEPRNITHLRFGVYGWCWKIHFASSRFNQQALPSSFCIRHSEGIMHVMTWDEMGFLFSNKLKAYSQSGLAVRHSSHNLWNISVLFYTRRKQEMLGSTSHANLMLHFTISLVGQCKQAELNWWMTFFVKTNHRCLCVIVGQLWSQCTRLPHIIKCLNPPPIS